MAQRAIESINDVKLRCHIDDNDCWHWRGSLSSGGADGTPYPNARYRGGVTSLSAILYHLRTGEKLPRGLTFAPTCGTMHCCNPKHRGMRIRGAVEKPNSAARIARIKLAWSRKRRISDEQVRDIRVSDEPTAVLAIRHQCDVSYVRAIKRGDKRRDAGIRGSSIFAIAA